VTIDLLARIVCTDMHTMEAVSRWCGIDSRIDNASSSKTSSPRPLARAAPGAIDARSSTGILWILRTGAPGATYPWRADWVDEYLLGQGIKPVIPSKENEDRAARAVEFDRDLYRKRSLVECLIGGLKESRRVFSRFEKAAKNFGGMIKMAFIQRYLRLCDG
jgi:transposase